MSELPDWAKKAENTPDPNWNPTWQGTPGPVNNPDPAVYTADQPTAAPTPHALTGDPVDPQAAPAVPPAGWVGPAANQQLDEIEVAAQKLGFLLVSESQTVDREAARLVGNDRLAKGVGFNGDGHLVVAWPDLPSPTDVKEIVESTGHSVYPAVAGRMAYKSLEWQVEQVLADDDYVVTLDPMVQYVIDQNASDLHISTGERPWVRLGSTFAAIPRYPRMSAEDTLRLARQIAGDDFTLETFDGDLDLAITFGSTRFRVNLYRERGQLAMALRTIPVSIPRFQTLGLPRSALKFTGLRDGMVIIAGPTGSGKRLTLSTPVPTPSGMSTMGDLKVGDEVFGADGKPCHVTSLSPIETHPDLYRVVFSDGQIVLADIEHQWLVSDHGARAIPNGEDRRNAVERHDRAHSNADAIELLASTWGSRRSDQRFVTCNDLFTILDRESLTSEFPSKSMVHEALRMMDCPGSQTPPSGPVGNADTYDRADTIDGNPDCAGVEYPTALALKALAERVRQRFSHHPATEVETSRMSTGEMLAAMRANGQHSTNFAVPVPGALVLPAADLPVDPYVLGTWLADGRSPDGLEAKTNSLTSDLDAIGVLNNKHIPMGYLRGSYEQRLALLQGFMDTDGTVDRNGDCELSLSDRRLVADTLALVRSLGIKATATTDQPAGYTDANGTYVEGQDRHRVHFTTTIPVFRQPRKAERIPETVPDTQNWVYITAIEPVLPGDADYEPGRCITVDSADHTYLCGDGFIPTSNTTSLASLLDIVNEERESHIVTLEAPIEYVHSSKRSMVHQREIGDDSASFKRALKSVLRQDPDIILVGEMRDYEEISLAITAAETGHLVFATVHAHNTGGVIDRVIDVFPPEQQNQVRAQLANTLRGVMCQKLLPDAENSQKRHLAYEIAFVNDAIRSVIASPDQANSKITESITSGRADGMLSFDASLAQLAFENKITREEASKNTIDTAVFNSYFEGLQRQQQQGRG